MARAISNKNVLTATFETANFEGAWLRSFGRPELRGNWIVFGGSGSGKTSFMMQLAKYLTGFGKVAYNSLEQGLSLSLQRAWERVDMGEAGNRIILLNKEGLPELRARLSKKQSPDIVIIDSIGYWMGVRLKDIMDLKDDFPGKLFVYVAHEGKRGEPQGFVAQKIRYDSDIKIHVEGYKAFFTTRYEIAGKGEGGADYVIWEEGAKKYWLTDL